MNGAQWFGLLLGPSMFETPRFAVGEAHAHRCPECHEDESCELACSHHLDPDDAEGPPKRGGYAACEPCAARLALEMAS